MSISESERDLLLAELYELRTTHGDDELRAAEIDAIVVLLGGDPSAVLAGDFSGADEGNGKFACCADESTEAR